VVEKGQTFYRIALIYGLTIDQLKALNNMSNTNIAVGQKLKVR
jgi:LysM repeat protein